jgi:hypothetical protein
MLFKALDPHSSTLAGISKCNSPSKPDIQSTQGDRLIEAFGIGSNSLGVANGYRRALCRLVLTH